MKYKFNDFFKINFLFHPFRTSLILIFFISVNLYAQLQYYNHPELNWKTIETDHYYIHFHDGTKRTASLTAKIAEEIFTPLTSMYDYKPDGKIHFIIRDHDDFSNGAAFYYNNKIELWAPSIEFHLRGTHNWLRNVITHELSHMISLGAARKMPRQIPALYFQWLGYEKEKRPDVLQGYPNRLVSFPAAGTVVPMWFAEGVAQFQRAGLDYDTWDSHRDMVLRTAYLENCMLSLNEMEIFGKKGIGNERVYNQGYGLTLYIAYHYGEEKLKKLIEAMKAPFRFNFSGSIKKILDRTDEQLYREWYSWLEQSYEKNSFPKKNYFILEQQGTGNYFPVISPDCSKIAYLSSQKNDYSSQLNLWLWNIETGKKKMLKQGVTSSLSWSPESDNLVYAKKTEITSHGSHYYDLYTYNLTTKKEKRITHFERVQQPAWSPENDEFICIIQNEGTCNLVLYSLTGKKIKQLTDFTNGEQLFTPRWTSEGHIVFTISKTGRPRNIAVIDTSNVKIEYLVKNSHDNRDAFPAPAGNHIFYSSDRNGIFNIYKINLDTKTSVQITDVSGGCFMPVSSSDGKLIFSIFQAEGYKIAYTDSIAETDIQSVKYSSPYQQIKKWRDSKRMKIADYDDYKIPEYKAVPYKQIYSKLSFFPRIMSDYPGKLKLGFYFSGSDFLEKISVFGGTAVNNQFDLDLFLIFNYKKLYPTLFIEAYNQRRHSSREEADYTFNLIEVDLGADWPLSDNQMLRTAYIFDRYDASMSFEQNNQTIKIPYNYHLGNNIRLKWDYEKIQRSFISSIAPDQGRKITLQADKAWYNYIDGFKIHKDYGTLVEEYKHYSYFRFLVDWHEYLPGLIKKHSLALRLKAAYIDREVDSFYNLFGGGLEGLKGYSYYSIEGTKLLHLSAAYRFPISTKMNMKLWFMHFDKFFLSLYAQTGNAWNHDRFDLDEWKKNAGIQFRLKMYSFYSFPISIFFDTAYGFDNFSLRDNDYGKEWRFYFGMLFGFID